MKNCKNCGYRFENYCLLSGEYFTTERRNRNYCDISFSSWIPEENPLDSNDMQGQWRSLIYAVQTKFPNETRFETALRYINEAEERKSLNNKCLENKS